MAELKGDIAEGIIRKTVVGTTEKYASLPIEKAAYVSNILDALLDAPRETKTDGSKYANVRPIQRVEAIVGADNKLTEKQQSQALKDILDEAVYGKYQKIKAAGYDNDEFAESYRLYLDTSGGKENTIQQFMRKLDIPYAAAKTLYEIYNPTRK
jgi:hypothetical protein